MTDLIERLHNFEGSDELGNGDFSLLSEAAAEIERLRAEVERLMGCLATANANHEQFERQWYLERDRAERLAEALRYCESWFERHSPTAALIGENGNAEHPMLTMIRSALAQEDRNG